MTLEVLVDMDGILCDIVSPWLVWINEQTGENLTLADITQRQVSKCSKLGGKVYGYFSHDNVFLDLDPLPGAIDGFRELCSHTNVTIVTAAKDYGHHNKIKWVKKHLPFFDSESMIFTNKKHMVRGDILFDDHVKHLQAFPGLGIGLKHPWNQAHAGEVILVETWEAFMQLMRNFDYGKNGLPTFTLA